MKQSILISYLIGVPIGLIVIALTILIPSLAMGEGLFSMVLLGIYGKPLLGLVISFLIALWMGGIIAFESIEKKNSLILTSFKYSTIVNSIIWTTFILIVLITVEEDAIAMIIPPIILFIICVIISTFTISLLVSYKIRQILRN